MADYNKDGVQYVGNMLVGPQNDYGVVFNHDGSFAIVADPFGATQVEVVQCDTSGNLRFSGTTGFVRKQSVTNITTAGAVTYTAAQILGGIITRDPNGAGRTDVTDTAVNLISTLNLTADGDSFTLTLINTADAAEAITLSAGVGVTISNVGQTLAQNESAQLIFLRTSASAVTLYIVGA